MHDIRRKKDLSFTLGQSRSTCYTAKRARKQPESTWRSSKLASPHRKEGFRYTYFYIMRFLVRRQRWCEREFPMNGDF